MRHGLAASSLAMQHFLYFLPLLQGQRSFRPILAISPTSFQRTDPVYQAVLADAKFHEQLLVFDRDLAASARAARCWLCGGALHSASYDRKPRGCPAGLGQEYAERFSFCCAVDGCRKRTTPPSLRFLGRKVYLATVVTLISAILLGTTPARLARLSSRAGDRSANPRPLAHLVAFDLYRWTLRVGRQGRPGSAARHCRSAGLAARPLCRRHRTEAHRLAAVPGSADRRRIGDARFLTGAANPQRMRVAGPRRGRLASAR